MDNAFRSKPYPGMTLAQLEAVAAKGNADPRIVAEIERRQKVAAGDLTLMYPAERQRYCRENPGFDFRTIKLVNP